MKRHCCNNDRGCTAYDCDQNDCLDCECGCSRRGNGWPGTCDACGERTESYSYFTSSGKRLCSICADLDDDHWPGPL